MIEAITSLIHNYKSKIRNPFFGALASVWLFRNWVVVYALFNFDEKYNMHYRIKYIKNYFSKKDFWTEFWINVTVTFLVLLITYVLFALSRFLTDLYYKICEPKIITLIDQNAIFTAADKSKLESRITLLNNKLERQNDAISRHELLNQTLNTRNSDLELEMKKQQLEFSESIKGYEEKFTSLKEFNINIKLLEKEFNQVSNDFINNTKSPYRDILLNEKNNIIDIIRKDVELWKYFSDKGFFDKNKDELKLSATGKLFFQYLREKDNLLF